MRIATNEFFSFSFSHWTVPPKVLIVYYYYFLFLYSSSVCKIVIAFRCRFYHNVITLHELCFLRRIYFRKTKREKKKTKKQTKTKKEIIKKYYIRSRKAHIWQFFTISFTSGAFILLLFFFYIIRSNAPLQRKVNLSEK